MSKLETKTSIYSFVMFCLCPLDSNKNKKENRIKRLLKCNINKKRASKQPFHKKDKNKTDDKKEVEWNETDTIK